MATTTSGGRRAAHTPRKRRLHPLIIVIPVIAAAVALVIALNGRAAGGPRPVAQLATADVHALLWSATDPNTVFFGHHDGMRVSRDRGTTWQPASLTGADAMSLAAMLRTLSDAQLDTRTEFFGHPMTVESLAQNGLVAHAEEHLASIRGAAAAV